MKIRALLIIAIIAINLLSVAANAASVSYFYDELDRLTQVAYDGVTAITYTYDEIGNRIKMVSNVSDTAKPVITGFTVPAVSASLTVPVTAFTATDTFGVKGYLITESSTPPLAGATGWTFAAPTSYIAATVGSHTLYPWVKNTAESVSAVFATAKTVVIDMTKPVITGFTVPAISASFTVPITTFTATDDIGVNGYLITESSTPPLAGATGWTTSAPTSYIAATAGSHTLYPWVKDAAGNVSAVFATARTVVITDTTKPVITGFTLSATSASLTVPITTFAATDNIGVNGYLITESSTPPLAGATGWTTSAPTSYIAAAAGSHTLYPWVKDTAGNVSAVFATARTVVITDTTKPVITGFAMPTVSASLTVPVTAFTATDTFGVKGYLITESSTPPLAGATGWTTSAPTSYIAAAAGSHTLYPWVKDAAGNVGTFSPVTINFNIANDTNIASQATVSASSQSSSTGQLATKAVDGVIDGYGGNPGDYTKEWATMGQLVGAWIQLNWPKTFVVSKIVLYDRPNLTDQVLEGQLTFSDGSSIAVGPLTNNGSATTISFAPKTVSWAKFSITKAQGLNIGLSELQVIGH